MAGLIRIKEATIPASNPPAGSSYIGVDLSDSMLYTKDSAGVTTKFPTLADLAGFLDMENVENYFNGLTLEPFSSDVTSNGTTVTMFMEKEGGGDVRYVLNGIVKTQDTTPALSVTLVPGTDSVPVLNYVYFDDTLGVQVSTVGFPGGTNEVKIATVLLQSAATVQTDGPLKHHQWDDHFEGSEGIGGHSHVTHWIRNQSATWLNGTVGTNTITVNAGSADNITFAISSGVMLQLHRKDLPALDMAGSDKLYVVNDSASPYITTTDINTLLTDSTGSSMSGKRFNLVFWTTGNQHDSENRIYVNLSSGSYTKNNDAISDKKGYANYDIPVEFRGVGFLICRMTLRHQTADSGTWTELAQEDLRGKQPGNVVAGSSGGASPGGADTTIQYNDGGAFGGAANLYYDNANSRLGVGQAVPTELLDINGTAKATLLKLADGTAAAPSYTFADDTNNGLYRIGIDSWATSVGGVKALSFSKSVGGHGNIAIGASTTSSSIALYISRSQAAGTTIQMENLTNSAGAYTGFKCVTGTGGGTTENNSTVTFYSGLSTTVSLSGRIALWNYFGKGTSLIGQQTAAIHGFYIGGNAESNRVMAVKDDEIVMEAAVISMANLPTSDPSVTGELWNNSGVLTIS